MPDDLPDLVWGRDDGPEKPADEQSVLPEFERNVPQISHRNSVAGSQPALFRSEAGGLLFLYDYLLTERSRARSAICPDMEALSGLPSTGILLEL